MSETERQQRISLTIQDKRLVLRVPISQEPYYRRAAEEINALVGSYHQSYAEAIKRDLRLPLMMASVDIAKRAIQWEEAYHRDGLLDRIERLSQLAEGVWLEHQYELNQLTASPSEGEQ